MLLCMHLSTSLFFMINTLKNIFKVLSKKILFQVFPNACFAWVKDADHLLHIEKPNEFNGTIINFLESWFGTKKKDENKNSMTNLQHFVWLLQYRLAILTSHKTLKTNRLNIVFSDFFEFSEKFSIFSVLLLKALE